MNQGRLLLIVNQSNLLEVSGISSTSSGFLLDPLLYQCSSAPLDTLLTAVYDTYIMVIRAVKHEAIHVVHSNTEMSSDRAISTSTLSHIAAIIVVMIIDATTNTANDSTGIAVNAQNSSIIVDLRGWDWNLPGILVKNALISSLDTEKRADPSCRRFILACERGGIVLCAKTTPGSSSS